MKYAVSLFFSLAVGGLAVASALGACGGSEATVVPDASTAEGGSSSGSSGASSSGSTSSSSSGGPTDGGNGDGSTSDSGTDAGPGTSNPNKITCGGVECNAPAQACCMRVQLDGGSTETCQAANANCQGGASVECDEAADCGGNNICCSDFSIAGAGTKCSGNCGGNNVQVCKTAGECQSGACTEYTCPLGRKVRACTKPAFCN